MLLCGCSMPPPNSSIRAEFLADFPTYTVIEVFVGEGDGAAAYYHIHYQRPGDPVKHETVRQYLKQNDGSWKFNHESPVK
jgi:hypothetical protein